MKSHCAEHKQHQPFCNFCMIMNVLDQSPQAAPETGSSGALCYAVVLEDRHIDVEVTLFLEKDTAIAWAKKQVEGEKELNEEMNSAMLADGWVYYCGYSCEGDSIRVIERVIDKEAPHSIPKS